VWCDFVARFEELAVDLDQDIARITPAIPAARLKRETSITVLAGSSRTLIPFEVVDFDTDQMTDLDRSAYFITPRRNGFYHIVGNITLTGGGAAGQLVSFGVMRAATSVASDDEFRSPGAGGYYLRSMTMGTWTGMTGSHQGWGIAILPNSVDAVILEADVSVYWASDRTDNS